MRCPKCMGPLQERWDRRGLLRVKCCADCRCVWFDGKELEAVLRDAFRKLKVPAGAQPLTLKCPRDRKSLLYSFHFPGTTIRVAMCENCGGLWLETGEFREIEHIRRELGAQGAPGREEPPSLAKEALLHFINTALDALDTP